MSADDLRLEREALATLLSRNADDAAAWSALKADGWLDTHPESAAEWSMVGMATIAVEAVARAHRILPVGAHLAAGAALAEVGDPRAEEPSLAVLVDVREREGLLSGRLWGDPAASTVVILGPQDAVLACDGERVRTTPDPLGVFEDAAVHRGAVAPDDAEPLPVADGAASRAAGRVAYFLAAEAVGAVSHATRETIAYLGQRQQFGQPLGSFQALQHRAVDMHMASVMGETLLERATTEWSAGDGTDASWAAKLLASTRLLWTAEEAIQLHGGIGFTWELGLHHALRRAQRARLLLGGRAHAADEVLARSSFAPVTRIEDWSLRTAQPPAVVAPPT